MEEYYHYNIILHLQVRSVIQDTWNAHPCTHRANIPPISPNTHKHIHANTPHIALILTLPLMLCCSSCSFLCVASSFSLCCCSWLTSRLLCTRRSSYSDNTLRSSSPGWGERGCSFMYSTAQHMVDTKDIQSLCPSSLYSPIYRCMHDVHIHYNVHVCMWCAQNNLRVTQERYNFVVELIVIATYNKSTIIMLSGSRTYMYVASQCIYVHTCIYLLTLDGPLSAADPSHCLL